MAKTKIDGRCSVIAVNATTFRNSINRHLIGGKKLDTVKGLFTIWAYYSGRVMVQLYADNSRFVHVATIVTVLDDLSAVIISIAPECICKLQSSIISDSDDDINTQHQNTDIFQRTTIRLDTDQRTPKNFAHAIKDELFRQSRRKMRTFFRSVSWFIAFIMMRYRKTIERLYQPGGSEFKRLKTNATNQGMMS